MPFIRNHTLFFSCKASQSQKHLKTMFLQDKLMWLLAFHKKEIKSCTKSHKTNSSRWQCSSWLLKRATAMDYRQVAKVAFYMASWSVTIWSGLFSLYTKQNCTFVSEVEEENRKSRKTWTHYFILQQNNQAPAKTEMPVSLLLKQIPFLFLDLLSHPQYPEPLQTPAAAGSSARDDPGGLRHQFWQY